MAFVGLFSLVNSLGCTSEPPFEVQELGTMRSSRIMEPTVQERKLTNVFGTFEVIHSKINYSIETEEFLLAEERAEIARLRAGEATDPSFRVYVLDWISFKGSDFRSQVIARMNTFGTFSRHANHGLHFPVDGMQPGAQFVVSVHRYYFSINRDWIREIGDEKFASEYVLWNRRLHALTPNDVTSEAAQIKLISRLSEELHISEIIEYKWNGNVFSDFKKRDISFQIQPQNRRTGKRGKAIEKK